MGMKSSGDHAIWREQNTVEADCTAALAAAADAGPVFTEIFREHAQYAAQDSARRWAAGHPLSDLDGTLFAIKDNIDAKGWRTTRGSATMLAHRPAVHDAAIVSACRSLGMIALGKTGLSEFAFSGLGINAHFGTPQVRDRAGQARAPGGSSSGSALAVAKGIVPMAIGTDTAGSIRIPAAFNGLVGFRGSTSRYAMTGIHPLAPTFDSAGALARCVPDCIRLDAAMRGWPRPLLRAARGEALRLVVDTDALEDPSVESAVRDNLQSTIAQLEAAGVRTTWKPVAAIARTRLLIAQKGWLGAVEALAHLSPILEGAQSKHVDPRIRARLDAARALNPETINNLRIQRGELMRAIGPELGGAILVLPTVSHVAPLLDILEADSAAFARANLATLAQTMIGSFLDMPGLALPSGFDHDGMPTSLQFALPRGEDDRLLSSGLLIEKLLARAGTQPARFETFDDPRTTSSKDALQ